MLLYILFASGWMVIARQPAQKENPQSSHLWGFHFVYICYTLSTNTIIIPPMAGKINPAMQFILIDFSIPYFGENCHTFVALYLAVWYIEYAAYPFWQRKGGEQVSEYTSLLNAILTGVFIHIICRWIDGK